MTPPATVFVIHPDPLIRQSVRNIAQALHMHCTSFSSARDMAGAGVGGNGDALVSAEVNAAGAAHPLSADAMPLAVVFSDDDPRSAQIIPSLPRAVDHDVAAENQQLEELLRRGLRAAEQERMYRDRKDQARLERAAILERLSRLSEAERSVLDRVLEGNLNKMIARALDVSVRTIEQRRRNIMNKMEVESLAELVRQVTKLQLYEELLD